jgi:hypothetical protein
MLLYHREISCNGQSLTNQMRHRCYYLYPVVSCSLRFLSGVRDAQRAYTILVGTVDWDKGLLISGPSTWRVCVSGLTTKVEDRSVSLAAIPPMPSSASDRCRIESDAPELLGCVSNIASPGKRSEVATACSYVYVQDPMSLRADCIMVVAVWPWRI